MEKNKPVPENVGQKGTNLDVVCKMLRGEIETVQISKDELPRYLAAGLASGFKVEEVAEAGGEYPHYHNDMGYQMNKRLEIFPVREGCVAVSIERPESSKDGNNAAFSKALGTLELEEKDHPSPQGSSQG